MSTPPAVGPRPFVEITVDNSIFATIFNVIIPYLLLFAGILAVFYLVWAGWRYLTSNGSEDQAKKARAGIVHAVIGIFIIMFCYIIIAFAAGLGKQVTNSDCPANNPYCHVK